MRFLLKHLRATQDGALLMLVMQGLLFLLGVVMVLVINAFLNEDKDYGAIGSMMALMGIVFGGLLRGAGAPVRYRMAVSMGHTRRAYLLADPLVTAINALLGIGAAWVLNKLELWFYSRLYPGWECEFTIEGMFKWWIILLAVVGVCVVDFCLGALQLRFGVKGFAIIWFPLCFAPMLIVNSMNAVKGGSTSLLAQLGRFFLFAVELLSPAMWAAAGIVIVLLLLVFSGLCYARAEVRT